MFIAQTFTPEQQAAMNLALTGALVGMPRSYAALTAVADQAIGKSGSGITHRYTDRWLQRQRKAGLIRTERNAQGRPHWVITDEGVRRLCEAA